MLYMQDMDPGPAKILHKPEKGSLRADEIKLWLTPTVLIRV